MARSVFRKDLAKLAYAYKNPVSWYLDPVIPEVGVDAMEGQYRKMNEDTYFAQVETSLTEDGYARESNEADSFESYSLEMLGQAQFISDLEMKQPGSYEYLNAADMLRKKVEFKAMQMKQDKEIRIANFLFDSGNYSLTTTLTGTDQWSDLNNSDPLVNVQTGIDALLGPANLMIMGHEVLRQLQRHSKITGATTVYGKTRKDPTLNPEVTVQYLANYFGIETVLVGRAIKDSTPLTKGTATSAQIWGKHVFIGYLDRNAATNPDIASFAKMLYLDHPSMKPGGQGDGTMGWMVKTTPDDRKGVVGGLYLDVGYAMQLKVFAAKLGYLIVNAVA